MSEGVMRVSCVRCGEGNKLREGVMWENCSV